MIPSQLYSQTLSQLDATELAMTSTKGDALIQAASPEEHQKAVQILLDVHQARLSLGNAALISIAEKLKTNEKSLLAGTAAVKASLKELNSITKIIETVSGLLKIVAEIVPMV